MPANSQSRGLAKDHRAGAAQQRHASRVRWRPMTLVDRRAELGRHVERIDDVLDADRHAVQRTAALRAIERARLRKRQFRIEIHPRFDDTVPLSDPRHAVARHRFARGLAACDHLHDLGSAELVEPSGSAACSFGEGYCHDKSSHIVIVREGGRSSKHQTRLPALRIIFLL